MSDNVASSGGMVCIPNVMLKSVFRTANDRLNICHVNAGAISPKIDEFRYIFENTMIDIIVATETWFKSYRSNASVSIDKYADWQSSEIFVWQASAV